MQNFARTGLGKYFMSLMVADFLHGTALSMDFLWASRRGITQNHACTAQGKQFASNSQRNLCHILLNSYINPIGRIGRGAMVIYFAKQILPDPLKYTSRSFIIAVQSFW
jgi:hypothetical protein